MADEKPENTKGTGGPGAPRNESRPVTNDEGQGRRSGRHRGFRGRHGGNRDASRESAPRVAPEGQARESGQEQSGREGQRPRDQRPLRPEEASRQEAARDMPACPLCGKPVYDLSTAIATNRETSDPAHFDCVLERVAASESLASGEKLVYLGSGAFGVVEFKDKNESLFTVKRRIQWEKEGEKKDWRKGLSSRISNL